MSTKSKGKSSSIKKAFWVTTALVALYVLGTGPLTRFAPGVAKVVYAPLTPVIQSSVMKPAFSAWFSVWGVDTDSKATLTAQK